MPKFALTPDEQRRILEQSLGLRRRDSMTEKLARLMAHSADLRDAAAAVVDDWLAYRDTHDAIERMHAVLRTIDSGE